MMENTIDIMHLEYRYITIYRKQINHIREYKGSTKLFHTITFKAYIFTQLTLILALHPVEYLGVGVLSQEKNTGPSLAVAIIRQNSLLVLGYYLLTIGTVSTSQFFSVSMLTI